MSSKWHEKKAKIAEQQFERSLWSAPDDTTSNVVTDGALGKGETQVFERKLTKEEKKAAAKAKRDAKKKSKNPNDDDDDDNENGDSKFNTDELLQAVQGGGDGDGEDTTVDDGIDHVAADKLASAGTICTFARNRKGVDSRSRDINVQNFTLQHMGMVMLDETELIFNHGNRYGLIGRNGSGKSTLLKVIGARAIPVPSNIDLFLLDQEVPPSDTITAIEAVMSVDEERMRLEQQADDLNHYLSILSDKMANNDGNDDTTNESGKTLEEQQEEIMEALTSVYERLDGLDADTAEVRARLILKGLGFTHEMQGKLTKDFSGGWRMRVALARALFLSPAFLVLDEPTAHLDMESVIWLEDRLSKYSGILLLVSHSQDFMNQVCTHTIHLTNKKKLQYYDGNYDQFVKTKSEKEENQMKQYKWEQDQIKSMKEYIARFGHGTAKNAKQAQSKEKVLEKMIRGGLTEKPEEEKPLNFRFADPGKLVPPVLAFHDVSFGYPGCQPLYTNVNLGVDLDSRIALVGPNGAGKTTLIKLMAGELIQTLGDIRPHGHLKLGRFTQHFVDVLDLDKTPLGFFEEKYPDDAHEDQRKYLGRFGVTGKMQLQKMKELSDGQKSRVVFAYLGRLRPHILLLDEPTNSLDPESIDALAKAINEFEGGMVLVSHDMRLISQVAKEIWICDNKTITPYKGDIQSFKLAMRTQMGLEDGSKQAPKTLRGDASVKIKDDTPATKKATTKKSPIVSTSEQSNATSKLETVPEQTKAVAPKAPKIVDTTDDATIATVTTTNTMDSTIATITAPTTPTSTAFDPAPKVSTTVATSSSTSGVHASVSPPIKSSVTTSSTTTSATTAGAPVKGRYVPPHLRKKMMEEQQQQQNL